MQFADKFIRSFLPDYSLTSVSENDNELLCEISATNFSPLQIAEIETAYDFIQNTDQFTYTIQFGEANPVTFSSLNPDFPKFINNLNAEYLHQTGEPITAKLTINKKNNTSITIYDLNAFTATIENLSIAQSFTIFNRVLLNRTFVNFNVLNLDIPFNTATIFFTPINSLIPTNAQSNRLKCIESIRTASYFTNIDEYSLTPDDFKILIENNKYKNICSLFNHFSTILSIIYLFDITTIKESELEFKINGYKSIKGNIPLKSYPINGTDDYFRIYKWVFNEGNLNDKIGLARNIISLHFYKDGDIGLKGNPVQSIQSSYKVYEKQNIKQYIEIRNKISDQLLDFNNRANKVIETFASGFQKSGLALISFYISAIVIKTLGKGEFINIFTLDASMLSFAFIAGSYIYYRVSIWEVKQQRQRFVDSYENLKERYTDLLDQNDIERILNNDKEFKADIRFIDNKLKTYSNMWKGFLLILFSTTLILFLTYNISQLFNTAIWKLIFNKSCNC